jgi:hypothetical protein
MHPGHPFFLLVAYVFLFSPTSPFTTFIQMPQHDKVIKNGFIKTQLTFSVPWGLISLALFGTFI